MNKTDKFKGYIIASVFYVENPVLFNVFLHLLGILAALVLALLMMGATVLLKVNLFSGPVLISIFGFLSAYTILFAFLRVKLNHKYSPRVLRILPLSLLGDNTWIDIAKAIENGVLITEKYPSSITRRSFKQLEKYIFVGGFNKEKYSKEEEIKDIENTVLWLRKLTTTPLLERTSVLLTLDTQEKREAFLDRDAMDLILFLSLLRSFGCM